jgi:hypothetical protein
MRNDPVPDKHRYSFECKCNNVYWEEIGILVDTCPECGKKVVGKLKSAPFYTTLDDLMK